MRVCVSVCMRDVVSGGLSAVMCEQRSRGGKKGSASSSGGGTARLRGLAARRCNAITQVRVSQMTLKRLRVHLLFFFSEQRGFSDVRKDGRGRGSRGWLAVGEGGGNGGEREREGFLVP